MIINNQSEASDEVAAIVPANTLAGRIWRYLPVYGLLFAVLTLSVSASSSTLLEHIAFSSLSGNRTEIRMQFDGPAPEPTGYSIEQPARISLDLPGVKSILASKYHPLGTSGNVRSVTVIEAADRTRVIVAMTELLGYSTRREGNQLVVLVGDALVPPPPQKF